MLSDDGEKGEEEDEGGRDVKVWFPLDEQKKKDEGWSPF